MVAPDEFLHELRMIEQPLSPKPSPAEAAIAYIEECQETHKAWAEYLAGDPDRAAEPDPQGPVGDIAHHELWMERYDHVLRVLRSIPS